MSALNQKAYEKYFGKSTYSPTSSEWFNSCEEPEDLAPEENAYEPILCAFHPTKLLVKKRKIKSAIQFKGDAASFHAFPELRNIYIAQEVDYAVRQQRPSETRKIVLSLEPRSLESQFYELATKWKEDTKLTSSSTEIVLNPSYQRIIGLGPEVIPLVLKDLQESGCHWFWALQALSGKNPIKDEDAGRIKKMTQAWLEWGKENSLI